MQYDHIIVGQGISGTLLSHSLMKLGRSVLVIDNGNPSSASKVASGVINPVTGKRLVRTWLIETLLPYAHNTYRTLEAEHNISILQECSILDMHPSREAQAIFTEKQLLEKDYLTVGDSDKYAEYFRFNYGIGEIAPCLLVDIQLLLSAWRQHLKSVEALIEEEFSLDNCDIQPGSIIYNGVRANNIIFCDGASCTDNPYFNLLPWSKDKGEALIVSIPGLPANNIYKQGISIVPWQNGLFWVGATHDWKFTDMLPTPAYKQQVQQQLDYWLKLPYTFVDHIVARRPVNVERRPFVGLHPAYPSVGIFNGMGTKGCSVAPYFAHMFAQHLVNDLPLMPEVDIRRFSRMLSRSVK